MLKFIASFKIKVRASILVNILSVLMMNISRLAHWSNVYHVQ